MSNELVTINKLELAAELAADATKDEMFSTGLIADEDEMFIFDDGESKYFTDEAQEIFNTHYDYFLGKIEKIAI